jgi:hypothetical protein
VRLFQPNGLAYGKKQLTYYPQIGYGSLDFCGTLDQAKVPRVSPPISRGKDVCWVFILTYRLVSHLPKN